METLTGHSTGGAALVQMLIVPVSLTFGILAMAVAAAIYM
jgi:3-oxoacyl-(acyl-carrier-protein) synthase